VVDNRTGAAGSIAAALVARASGDGYTGLIISSSYAINPSLYEHLPFDPLKDFAPVALIAEAPFVLVVHPTLPVRTVADLIARAKDKPGGLTFASGGTGSSGHLAGELFKHLTGAPLTHIPYKGAGPALIDVIAGQVDLTFASVLSSLPHLRTGKLKALGVTGARRSAALPDAPTIAESGVKDYATTTWYGLLLPATAPATIVDKLNHEVRKALTAPDLSRRFTSDGAEAADTTPGQFRKYLGAEVVKWRSVVRAAHVRME
ncbi:MAG TPA: tripartite tricarboxylate transporter substrate binding protein, partial [Burkholderiales bacterium]|nr:tripartite tricarboxylate transporter substrate binding protein [Burkholderiales bacterium]